MKKLALLLLGLALPAGVAVFATAGCSKPCNDLAAKCSACGDADYQKSCREIVARGNDSVCAGELSTFTTFCTDDGSSDGGNGGGGVCSSTETQCLGECVNLLANQTFCGSCNTACAEAEFCAAGSCVTTCPDSLPDSCTDEPAGNICVNFDNDVSNCGSCGNACATGQVCLEGACADSCDPDGSGGGSSSNGLTNCDGSCANLANDPLHCGTCANACAAGQLCSNGACASSCGDGLTECCGKCVNTASDPANCGGCACDDDSGSGGAGGGTTSSDECLSPQCKEGTGGSGGTADPLGSDCTRIDPPNDCSEIAKCALGCCTESCEALSLTDCNGACVDTQADVQNCGACGNVCGSGEKCNAGLCQSGDCPAGQTDCNGSCVNLQQNPAHCGECHNACNTMQLCSQGECASECDADKNLLECPDDSGTCVDISNDPDNCGACGTICPSTASLCQSTYDENGLATATGCVSACDAGLTECNGGCVDTATSFNNCGACGNSCNDNSVCTFDTCGTETAGTCKNESGALLCSDGDICTEDKCDEKDGCKSTALSANAILQVCKLTNPPVDFDENDPQELQCLYCNSENQENPCEVVDREDGRSCTVDTCDPLRLDVPTHVADDSLCTFGCADTCDDPDNPEADQGKVDTTSTEGTLIDGSAGPTGCVEDDDLCTAGGGNNGIVGFACTTECDVAGSVDERYCTPDNGSPDVCEEDSCAHTCVGQVGNTEVDIRGCQKLDSRCSDAGGCWSLCDPDGDEGLPLTNAATGVNSGCAINDTAAAVAGVAACDSGECCDPEEFMNTGSPAGCDTPGVGNTSTCTPIP